MFWKLFLKIFEIFSNFFFVNFFASFWNIIGFLENIIGKRMPKIYSPIKPYSYPAPSPSPPHNSPGQKMSDIHESVGSLGISGNISGNEALNMNYPNIKFYKNNGLNISDFNQEWINLRIFLFKNGKCCFGFVSWNFNKF